MGTDEIRWSRQDAHGCVVVRPRGELNVTTYRRFSDDLVKFAMDEPDAVIVDIAGLRIVGEPLLTAFSAAWMRVGEWPGVPILLVAESRARRAALRGSAINRYVPVFDSLTAALAGVAAPPVRRRATVELAMALTASGDARRFVRETCGRWGVAEVTEHAEVVVTELVENVLLHTRSDLRLRLELRDDVLTVAVDDDDPHQAVLRESGPQQRRAEGLRLVAALALAWGSVPKWPGGKVVWATLPTGARRRLG